MGATASLDTPAVRVECGATAELAVTVRNTGTLVDELHLEVLGEPRAWSVVEPPVLRLFPGAEGTATVRFSPPRDSRTPHGQLPFGLRVVPREDPAGGVVEEGQVVVAPFVELSAEILPRTSKSWRRASHRIAVDNRGNAPVQVTLTASDPDAALAFDVRPPAFLAAPGSATVGRVRVAAHRPLWRGTPLTFPFTVDVQPSEPGAPLVVGASPPAGASLVAGASPAGAPLRLDGTFGQRPIVPPTLPRTLATVFALILAAIVAWTLVVRPSVQKAAREEVAAPLAQADQNIQTVADKVGVQVPSITGGSASPMPSASAQADGVGNDPLLGAPLAIRIHVQDPPDPNPNQPEVTIEAVPLEPKQALTITGFSVQNPYHDLGVIWIARRGPDGTIGDADVFLKASLSDISTQTTVLTPPLVLPPGTTLVARVQCTKVGGLPTGEVGGDGQPVLLPQGNTCDTSVLVNGYTRSTTATPSPAAGGSASPTGIPSPSAS